MSKSRYRECYVAFLDILGFKNLIDEAEFDQILEIFNTISVSRKFEIALHRAVNNGPADALDEVDRYFLQYNKALHDMRIYSMSDSIVISSRSKDMFSLECLIDVVIFVQNMLYDMDSPVLLRGAVAKGSYYSKGTVAFGRAMVDAYIYQEAYSRYPRVILSGELVSALKNKSYVGDDGSFASDADAKHDAGQMDDTEYFLKYDHGHILKDDDDYYFIDCIQSYLGGKDKTDPEFIRFRKLIEKYLNGYYDESIKEKYRWLNEQYMRIVEHSVKANLRLGTF